MLSGFSYRFFFYLINGTVMLNFFGKFKEMNKEAFIDYWAL